MMSLPQILLLIGMPVGISLGLWVIHEEAGYRALQWAVLAIVGMLLIMTAMPFLRLQLAGWVP